MNSRTRLSGLPPYPGPTALDFPLCGAQGARSGSVVPYLSMFLGISALSFVFVFPVFDLGELILATEGCHDVHMTPSMGKRQSKMESDACVLFIM